MGGSGDQKVTTYMHQAQFIEDAHQVLIWAIGNEMDDDLTFPPFQWFVPVDIDSAVLGVGFALSSFPSLYDMYGKFMAGLDVDALFDQIFLQTTSGPLITNLVAEQATELADDIEVNALPRYEAGMRDINAVMSSSFVIGRSNIEVGRIKALSKFDAELRYKMIPVAGERWRGHLDWNKAVIEIYAQIIKLYVSGKIDIAEQWAEIDLKQRLWDYTIIDNLRLAIGATSGGHRTSTDALGGKPTQTQKAIGGAMTGAAIGTEINAGWGTAIGAVVGAAAGYFM